MNPCIHEISLDLGRDPVQKVSTISDISSLTDAAEVNVLLRIKASEVLRANGETTIAGDIPQPDDLARAYRAAMDTLPVTADAIPLFLSGLDVSLEGRLTGFGLPEQLPARRLRLTVPYVSVRPDMLAELRTQVIAAGRELGGVRVIVQDDAGGPADRSTVGFTSADLSSLALWLDGMAKFIDMTKAHLPDIHVGRILMCQKLYRQTMVLKKRVQEINGSTQAPPTSSQQRDATPERDADTSAEQV